MHAASRASVAKHIEVTVFPPQLPLSSLFFSSPLQRDTDTLCRSSRSSKHWDRLWKEAEAGETSWTCAACTVCIWSGPDSAVYSPEGLHNITGNVFPSTQDAHYGLPSPRKKMRFFAIFWLRVCMVSAFCRVRWAQSFQNLGSFSASVRDDKEDKLCS